MGNCCECLFKRQKLPESKQEIQAGNQNSSTKNQSKQFIHINNDGQIPESRGVIDSALKPNNRKLPNLIVPNQPIKYPKDTKAEINVLTQKAKQSSILKKKNLIEQSKVEITFDTKPTIKKEEEQMNNIEENPLSNIDENSILNDQEDAKQEPKGQNRLTIGKTQSHIMNLNASSNKRATMLQSEMNMLASEAIGYTNKDTKKVSRNNINVQMTTSEMNCSITPVRNLESQHPANLGFTQSQILTSGVAVKSRHQSTPDILPQSQMISKKKYNENQTQAIIKETESQMAEEQNQLNDDILKPMDSVLLSKTAKKDDLFYLDELPDQSVVLQKNKQNQQKMSLKLAEI